MREEENPAFIAQVTIDFSEFWQTLTLTQQTIALYFQRGYRTNEIAELIGVSAGRISQIRKELRDGWQEFIGEE